MSELPLLRERAIAKLVPSRRRSGHLLETGQSTPSDTYFSTAHIDLIDGTDHPHDELLTEVVGPDHVLVEWGRRRQRGK